MQLRYRLWAGGVAVLAGVAACTPASKPAEPIAASVSTASSTVSPSSTTAAPSPTATPTVTVSPSPTMSTQPTSQQLFATSVAAIHAIQHAMATGDVSSRDLSNDLAPQTLTGLVDAISKLQAKGWASAGSQQLKLISATVGPTGRDAAVKVCVLSDWHFFVKKTGKPIDNAFRLHSTIQVESLVLLDGRWKFASHTVEGVTSC